MKQHQRVTDFYSLVASQHGTITSVADAAWTMVSSIGEVRRVRDFLSQPNQGVHHLNLNLPALFTSRGYEVKFASILVHQKPIVVPLENFETNLAAGLSTNPELGDLNLVFLFLDSDKNVRLARSVLYQAKQTRVSDVEAIQEEHQKYLYDRASGFRYISGHLKDQKRRLPIAQGRRRGLHYLFVSENPVSSSPVPSGRPAYVKWSESLFRLMIDAEGVGLAAGHARGCGWSRINQDLLSLFEGDAGLKTHNLSELASWFNDFRDPNHWHASAGENSVGVNTLFVIVRDQKLPPSKNRQMPIVLDSPASELRRRSAKKKKAAYPDEDNREYS